VRTQLIGDHTPNPNTKLYTTDLNNFAPRLDSPGRCPGSVKTRPLFAPGYGIGYERLPIYLTPQQFRA